MAALKQGYQERVKVDRIAAAGARAECNAREYEMRQEREAHLKAARSGSPRLLHMCITNERAELAMLTDSAPWSGGLDVHHAPRLLVVECNFGTYVEPRVFGVRRTS